MRVIVCTSMTPFQAGGAELLASSLVSVLTDCGHQVELLELPFQDDPGRILDQMLAFRLIDLGDLADRLIAIRFPSYLVRHPRKLIWFIHHYRAVYDLWGTAYSNIPSTPEGLALRKAVRNADQVALGEALRVYANSRVVAGRLAQYNGIPAEVLYPPLLNPERYRCGEYGDYLLYIARFTGHKRQSLAVQAMCHTRTPVRLVLAGRVDPGAESYVAQIKQQIAAHGLDERVLVLDRGLSEKEKIALLADCLAALYIAFKEDSYGFFSLEAHCAGKAVLTTLDAGGVTELVINGINGRIVAPDPETLAMAMDELYRDRQAARSLGRAGVGRIDELGISWPRVIQKLLA